MKTNIYSIFVFLFAAQFAFAQEQPAPTNPLTISGYLETYYLYNFNNPENNSQPGFVYSHNRVNEFNLNLGFVKAAYATEKVRGNFALMTGTYANANLAAEPGVVKNIFEANAGVKISSTKNLWVDGGIFASHIGFESAVSKDCWNLTRSILADNSPYYESGAKISYTSDNGKWFLSGLVLNGWQRIQRVEGNSLPSFGTQVTYKPSPSVTISSSSFIGTDKPDSVRQMRYFHNFYGIFQLSEKLGLTLGFDSGAEEKSSTESATNAWYSPVIIMKYAMTGKLSIVIRGEYYQDENGVIIATGTSNGFKTTGISLNLDYAVAPNAVWRIEARNFTSKDAIFIKDEKAVNDNTFLTTSLAISF
jgi:hypothetical protein